MSYHFNVGPFECIVVSDGTMVYPHPAQLLFANAPKAHLDSVLREHDILPDEWKEYVSPYPSLVIKTGSSTMLVDTGAGSLMPTTGKLIPNLRADGISPEQIDIVVLTHGHPDHIGGNVDAEGKPAFPKARYVMSRTEWDFWSSGPDLSALEVEEPLKQWILEVAQRNLPPIESQLELIEMDAEIAPGIEAMAAPGHTPGHMAIRISAGQGESFIDVADAVVHPIHLEQPDWCVATDFDKDQTVATRQRLLERAAQEEALVFAYHFSAPGLGYVIQHGETWKWQAVAGG